MWGAYISRIRLDNTSYSTCAARVKHSSVGLAQLWLLDMHNWIWDMGYGIWGIRLARDSHSGWLV